MGKNKELENIKVHMDMLLTDDICEDAVISKKDHDLHFQIFRLLTGYGELLEKIKYGSTAQPTTRPMTAEERKQWACEHRDEYWFTYKELGHHPEGFHMHTFADRYKDYYISMSHIDERGRTYPGKEWKKFPLMVPCGECEGSGEIDWSVVAGPNIIPPMRTSSCPNCSGSGWVVQEVEG